MYHLRRAVIAVVFLGALAFLTWFLPRALNPTPPSPEDQKRDKAWVASSPYWIDRQACRWFSVCGVHHMRWDDPVRPRDPRVDYQVELELKKRAPGERATSTSWEDIQRRAGEEKGLHTRATNLKQIPDFVLKHAPLVHLYSGEHFWPSDIAEHVRHMEPFVGGDPVNMTEPVGLANMRDLNSVPGFVFLTSKDDVEQRPEWLSNDVGKPKPYAEDESEDPKVDPADGRNSGAESDSSNYQDTTWWDISQDTPLRRISAPQDNERRDMLSKLRRRLFLSGDNPQQPFPPPPDTPGHKPDASGYSAAPAVLVVVDKGSGITDAFWFFFYSYNLGQTVLDMRFGNHVGDWEHCMVRFENGVPRAMFLSEHEGGQAYAWAALEKKSMNTTTNGASEIIERPVIYSAAGSHAMYAFPGDHAYVLPFNMLKDQTDRGPLWDPSLNNYAYFYNHTVAPPPPEEDEGALEKRGDTMDESTPYPVDQSVIEAYANVTLRRHEEQAAAPTSLAPAASNPDAPTSWFHFNGPWGDELYSLGDYRQWRLFGQYHYVTGPMGPKFKNLGREKVCQKYKCRILYSIDEGRRSSWHD